MLLRVPNFLFLFHYSSAVRSFCDGFLYRIRFRIWNQKFQNHFICIFTVQYRNLAFSGNILDFSDSSIICCYFKRNPLFLLDQKAFGKPLLYSFGIRSDQSSCSEKYTSKISCHDHRNIINIFSQNNIKHRTPCGS